MHLLSGACSPQEVALIGCLHCMRPPCVLLIQSKACRSVTSASMDSNSGVHSVLLHALSAKLWYADCNDSQHSCAVLRGLTQDAPRACCCFYGQRAVKCLCMHAAATAVMLILCALWLSSSCVCSLSGGRQVRGALNKCCLPACQSPLCVRPSVRPSVYLSVCET